MDGMWLEDRNALERQIREMMAHQVLPPEVVGFDVEFGDHPAFGDPAAWIHLHVPGAARVNDDEAREFVRFMTDTSLKLANIVPHRMTSVLVVRPPAEQAWTPVRAGS